MSAILSSGNIALHVTIYIDPKNVEPFMIALRSVRSCLIEEPECLLFDVFCSDSRPGIIRLVEVWAGDREWFENIQLKKEYYGPFMTITKPMWLQPMEAEHFSRVQDSAFVADGYLSEGVGTRG